MKLKHTLIVIALLLSLAIFANTFNPDDTLPMDETMIHGTLDNGLTYYIKRNTLPQNHAEFRLALRVGAIHEDDDQLGIAHFVEHLGFGGTESFPGDSLRVYLNSLGFGFLGGLNAATSIEYTFYILQSRTENDEQLDTSVLILSDWAARMTLNDDEIDKERGIILEEMRGRRGAGDRMQRELFGTLFEDTKYANRMPIGTADVITNVDYQRIRDFYNDWYRPDLMAVVAVGDFDQEYIETLIHKHFNSIPRKENPRLFTEIDIPSHENTRFSIYTDPEATRTNFSIWYKHPTEKIETVADYRNLMIDNFINNMLSNRFTEISRQPNPPFVNASGRFGRVIDPSSAFILSAIVDENQVLEGFTSVITEIERVIQHGFHNSELVRARNSILSWHLRNYNERNTQQSASLTMRYMMGFMINEPNYYLMNPEYEFELNNFIANSITINDVTDAIKSYVTEQNRVVTINAPENSDIEMPTEETILALFDTIKNTELEPFPETILDEPLISSIPKRVKVKKPSYNRNLNLYSWSLKNGATVYLKPTDFRSDEIILNAGRHGGLSTVEDDNFISARVAAQIVTESGINNFDKNMLDIYLSDKNISLSVDIRHTVEDISGYSNVADIETLMQLLYLTFTEPRFDENAFNTWKNRTEIAIRNQHNSPQHSFNLAVNSLLYNDHFRMQNLTVEDIENVNHQEAIRFYKSRFDSANGFNFIFVGNINPKELQPLIEKYIAIIPNKNADTTLVDRGIYFNQVAETREVFHGQDDRTMVRLIYPNDSFNYTIKNMSVLTAMNSVMFEMLNEHVREKMSGVYMIQPFPTLAKYYDWEVVMNVLFGCDQNRIEELIEEVNRQFQILIDNEFDDKYLHTFKESSKQRTDRELRTNRYWANQILGSLQNGFVLNDILILQDVVENISRDDVADAAKKYLNIDNIMKIILYPEP